MKDLNANKIKTLIKRLVFRGQDAIVKIRYSDILNVWMFEAKYKTPIDNVNEKVEYSLKLLGYKYERLGGVYKNPDKTYVISGNIH